MGFGSKGISIREPFLSSEKKKGKKKKNFGGQVQVNEPLLKKKGRRF